MGRFTVVFRVGLGNIKATQVVLWIVRLDLWVGLLVFRVGLGNIKATQVVEGRGADDIMIYSLVVPYFEKYVLKQYSQHNHSLHLQDSATASYREIQFKHILFPHKIKSQMEIN
ncbi:hypothetical protein ACJX0J_022560 [Zea mays]